MKNIHTTFSLCLPAIAALIFAPIAGQAAPLFAPLLTSTSLRVLLSPPENALTASSLPTAPPPLLINIRASLGTGSLWSRTLDPSLWMTDWRQVFDIAALGSFEIPLRNDPAERANILLAAAAVDHAVVAPGAEFSFNDQVGERTPERGYQEGLMFDSGQIVRGTGGGICLVATALYNAALEAGVEITERHPHSGLVSYAPPGCDAGIYFGLEDLRFRNTTGRPLVIRTEITGDHVTVQLFGQTPPPGLAVSVKPTSLETIPYAVITKPDATLLPGQRIVAQKPRSGYNVVVERFWTQGHRVVRREIVAQERRAPGPRLCVSPSRRFLPAP